MSSTPTENRRSTRSSESTGQAISSKSARKRRLKLSRIALVLLIVAAVLGLFVLYLQHGSVSSVERASVADRDVVSVYYQNDRGLLEKRVVDVQRQLPEKLRAEALFSALKDSRCIPDRLKLYDLAIARDGVLYLNVSKEFLDRNTPEREIAMTYGIVNSFIESFPGVHHVQLLVEGAPVHTRSGLLYLFKPLPFNKDLLEE